MIDSIEYEIRASTIYTSSADKQTNSQKLLVLVIQFNISIVSSTITLLLHTTTKPLNPKQVGVG
jgi:hypothetical protein